MRYVGTVVRGIRAPIFKRGDDLAAMTVECVLQAAKAEGFSLGDRDVVAVTESTLARTQGNYATVEQIAQAVRELFPGARRGSFIPSSAATGFPCCSRASAWGWINCTFNWLTRPTR